MKRSQLFVAAMVVVGILGTVLITSAFGLYTTESTRVPARITVGEFEGAYNPADIRGSYTFADVAEHFALDGSQLVAAFVPGAPDVDPSQLRAGDLESLYEDLDLGGELGTDSLRLVASLYSGLPYIPEDTTLLPLGVREILARRVTPADLAQWDQRFVDLSIYGPSLEGVGMELAETEEHDEVSTEFAIKGTTSFYELLEAGLTVQRIEEILGMAMGYESEKVRDFCLANGLEYAAVKAALAEALGL